MHASSPDIAQVSPSLDHFRAMVSGTTGRIVADSLRFAGGAALIAFVAGALLAWINERTNAPFKRLFFALSIVPLVIPGVDRKSVV